jgi:VCBS repeat-containing protein
VTINGTNDAAVITGDSSVSADETNAALTLTGTLAATDVDSSHAFVAQSDVAGTNGHFSIGTDGAWSYVANEAFDALNVGSSVTDNFTVATADGTEQLVTVNINGTNELVTGTTGGDVLTGSSAADNISGLEGNDNLTGGAGNDIFIFDTNPDVNNVDTITDFTPGEDLIRLSSTVFTSLTAGTLTADEFFAGTAANDATDRIIYDSESGNLYYDADGTGDTEQVLIATLVGTLTLDQTSFEIVA